MTWAQVSKVDCNWGDANLYLGLHWLWRLTGTQITVKDRDGVTVTHSLFHPHQGRFLDDLRHYVPKDIFAPGIYDWRP